MDSVTFDLAKVSVRDVNKFLHKSLDKQKGARVVIDSPNGAHNIAVGMDTECFIEIRGHSGYYAAGMNQLASIDLWGNAGTGVAENMMSGRVHVHGCASNAAGASAHGGLLVIDEDAGLRCGISLKGGDIVVGGSVGSFSAFMAQAGRMIICGDAGHALGDSLYEAVIYIKGQIQSLGADAREEEMSVADYRVVASLLAEAGSRFAHHKAQDFRRVASARGLYHWNADANQEY